MPSITAVLHTHDDALRLGRALETLYPCDQIVVVDHGSEDATLGVAYQYGASVISSRPGAGPGDYVRMVASNPDRPVWAFCLDPHESISEKLAASLFEWKSEPLSAQVPAFSVYVREETAQGWVEVPSAQTRLVPPDWSRWQGMLPAPDSSATPLEGELLRFIFP